MNCVLRRCKVNNIAFLLEKISSQFTLVGCYNLELLANHDLDNFLFRTILHYLGWLFLLKFIAVPRFRENIRQKGLHFWITIHLTAK